MIKNLPKKQKKNNQIHKDEKYNLKSIIIIIIIIIMIDDRHLKKKVTKFMKMKNNS